MKKAEDIENLSVEELIEIAEHQNHTIPDDLEYKIEKSLSEYRKEEKRHKKSKWFLGSAATLAVSVAASLIIIFSSPSQPEDTFDDPLMAYHEMEKAFSLISSKVNEGKKSASTISEEFFLKQEDQYRNITQKAKLNNN